MTPQTKSETPLTDGISWWDSGVDINSGHSYKREICKADDVRQLERELNEAKSTIENINKGGAHLAKVIDERDQLRTENAELLRQVETLHKAAKGETEFGIVSRQLIKNHELKQERDSLQNQLNQRQVQLRNALDEKEAMHAVMCVERTRADSAEALIIGYRQNEMQMLELYKLMPDQIENQYTDRLFYHVANYLHMLRLTKEQLSAAQRDVDLINGLDALMQNENDLDVCKRSDGYWVTEIFEGKDNKPHPTFREAIIAVIELNQKAPNVT